MTWNSTCMSFSFCSGLKVHANIMYNGWSASTNSMLVTPGTTSSIKAKSSGIKALPPFSMSSCSSEGLENVSWLSTVTTGKAARATAAIVRMPKGSRGNSFEMSTTTAKFFPAWNVVWEMATSRRQEM
eukprot:CAMPEP_0204080396 /NCGR_PEP_ID=MMETSP0360-20130528/173906_1 /ASSEMBLY_ACC=CAM_ASM_000342 /TAXON_ID=268821 /ORGANISM="Scrippsiella Hangoei, Strain SHTV-5" /LENGTH=127 /DNA_ID=CAMNT_0051029173 /DNA_START=90 /DNA_END=470 /DNA_ORIENTATION=-